MILQVPSLKLTAKALPLKIGLALPLKRKGKEIHLPTIHEIRGFHLLASFQGPGSFFEVIMQETTKNVVSKNQQPTKQPTNPTLCTNENPPIVYIYIIVCIYINKGQGASKKVSYNIPIIIYTS